MKRANQQYILALFDPQCTVMKTSLHSTSITSAS